MRVGESRPTRFSEGHRWNTEVKNSMITSEATHREQEIMSMDLKY